jgi:kynurenine formamidase
VTEPLAGENLFESLRGLKVVDLSHTIEPGMPGFPTHPQYFHMEWHTGDPATLHQLLISEHAGTHLDAPLHFYNSPGDARRVPLDRVPVESFVGRAVKLEFQGLAPTTELGADDIRRWERQHFPLRQGDAAVFHFGWDRKWAPQPNAKPFLEAWPGIRRQGAEYLADRQVRLVGTDCLGIDGSATADLGAHFTLLERRVLIVENLDNLDQVPAVFWLVTLPLKIKDGSGSPIRAIGLFG